MTPRNFLFPLFASAVYLLAQITVQTNLDQRQQHALSFLISCNGNVGTNFFPQGDFGTGSDSLLAVDPGFAVDFVFSSSAPPPDGTLVYTNDTQPWNINPNWINTTDNGSEPMSYMMLVNAAETTGVFFEQTFDVCENNAFEISADFINILNNTAPSNTNPDISFLINGLEIFSTGALPQDENWHTFATTYQTAVGEQDFTLQLRSNTIAANENVFAVDNIALRACGPDVTAEELNPTPHCPNDTLQLEINVGPDYSNPFIQWQISLDEGNNWTNFGSATTNNTLQIASVPYLARYRALVANADSNIVLNTCTIISNEVIPTFNDIDVCASSIVDLDDRCSGLRGENILPDGDFGSGQSNTLEFDPGFAPGYIYTTDPPPSDGDYTITNNTTSWGDFALNGWINTGDNSADPEGYMMVVNATVQPGAFFQRTVDVCENTNYEFSVDVINVVEPIGVQRIQPLVDFQIDGLTLYSTGNVPQDGQWHTYGFSFTTAPGVSEVTLTLLNNAPGGIGNDLALDNISFLACGPEVETGAVAEGPYCPGDPAEISIGIGPGLDDPIIQWQLSLDGGNNWENTGTPSTDTFLVINSLPYQAQYRALVAESEANLANIACSALSEPILFDFSPIEDCYTNPIAQTGPICNGLLGPELIPDGNFGSGVDTVGPALPAGVTTYNYTTDSFQIDGNYSILNQLYFDPGAGNFPDTAWIQLQDQSENPEDYFMLINADDQRGIFYQTEITGLCENTSYQFSADFINVLSRYFGPFGNFSTSILPDIDFVVAPVGTNRELLEAIPAAYNTGGILNDSTWHHHGFTFETQAGQTSVIVALRNHAGVGNGNDFVIDNVSLRTCFGQANVFINPIC
ncbi:MAG: hypothetical protein MRY78_11570, partial [Saprospiraceae bacterium]|nr:hypothetical protein [Saprospiraceae bacterium]